MCVRLVTGVPRRSRGLGEAHDECSVWHWAWCGVFSAVLSVQRAFGFLPGSVENFLLKKAKEAPEDFDKLYVVAASFEDVNDHTTVKALFNNQAYHSPSLALALVDNVLFKLLSGANASITTTNYPQPQTAMELSETILYQCVRLPYSPLQASDSVGLLTFLPASSSPFHLKCSFC